MKKATKLLEQMRVNHDRMRWLLVQRLAADELAAISIDEELLSPGMARITTIRLFSDEANGIPARAFSRRQKGRP